MTDSDRDVVRDFLATRRARITPVQAGLPSYGQRRVPGLRREEVATLAGVSVDYYARLERGYLSGVSDSVLEAVARALQLDEAERAHLIDLARVAGRTAAAPRRPSPHRIRPGVQQLLDAMTGAAALIRNGRLDYVAANQLGRALFAPMFEGPALGNSARFTFLDASSVDFYPAWDRAAREIVALLRGEAGRNPYDRGLTDLVGELSTRSETFRALWASYDVRLHRTGAKSITHPLVGAMDLSYEAMELTADAGLVLNAFTAAPSSPSAEALGLLASWATPADPTRHAASRSAAAELGTDRDAGS